MRDQWPRWTDALEISEVNQAATRLFGKEVERFKSYTTGSGKLDGQVLVIEVCKQHECDSYGGIFILDFDTGGTSGGLHAERDGTVYLGDYQTLNGAPGALRAWVKEWGSPHSWGVRFKYVSRNASTPEVPRTSVSTILYCESNTVLVDGRDLLASIVSEPNGHLGLVMLAVKSGALSTAQKTWEGEFTKLPNGLWISHFAPPKSKVVSGVLVLTEGRTRWSLKMNIPKPEGSGLIERYVGGSCSTDSTLGGKLHL